MLNNKQENNKDTATDTSESWYGFCRNIYIMVMAAMAIQGYFLIYTEGSTTANNSAYPLLEAPLPNEISINSSGISYIKVCSSGKIIGLDGATNKFTAVFQEISGENKRLDKATIDFMALVPEMAANKKYIESIIFLVPLAKAGRSFPLVILTDNRKIDVNVSVSTSIISISSKVSEALVDPIKMQGVSRLSRFSMLCTDSLRPLNEDEKLKKFFKKHNKGTTIQEAINFAEQALKSN